MTKPALQIVHSLARLQCTKCHAEANASCNCGKPYVPMQIATDYAKANPTASIHKIEEETGVSHATAQRAGDTPVVGRDGKTYKAKCTSYENAVDEPDPGPTVADYRRELLTLAGTALDLAKKTKKIFRHPNVLTKDFQSEELRLLIGDATAAWQKIYNAIMEP